MIDLVTAGQPVEPWRLYPGENGPDRDIFADRSLDMLSRVEVDVRARAGGVGSAVIPAAR